MKTLRYICAVIVIFIVGCSSGGYYRPMAVGMTWQEKETVHINLMTGKYLKQCQYTEVYVNGSYKYTCGWKPVEGD